MPRQGDRWLVQRGDCLWNIAKSVYGNGKKWTQIADANGIKRSSGIIYAGQKLKLPGITAGTKGSGGSASTPTPVSKKVTIDWWALDADEERNMFCAWSFKRDKTDHFEIKWYYGTGQGPEWRFGGDATVNYENTDFQYALTGVDDSAKKVKLTIKPISKEKDSSKHTYYWTDGEVVEVTYDYSNNPPKMPEVPEVVLQNGKITASLTNIDADINADSIEFAIYLANETKYKTGISKINTETHYAIYVADVDPGGSYTVRCRAVRDGSIYSNWTDFTEAINSVPISPKEITQLKPEKRTEQGAEQYFVSIEWTAVDTADHYEIQWTTDPSLFDVSGDVHTQTTDPSQGNKALISDIELGHEYFFRVRAINDQGESGWTPIKSVTLGQRPAPPSTWSSTVSAILGETLNLYWVHNPNDGSLETVARIHFLCTDLAHPSSQPLEFTKIVNNTKPEEDRDKPSVYPIDTTDNEWAFLTEGFSVKWKVQTCGITSEYSDWSIEREIIVYSQPTLTLDLKNQNASTISEVTCYPFYISVLARPFSQNPISYYIEVIANDKYETVDSVGKSKVIDIGDKVYTKYYDPPVGTEKWNFLAEMTPGNIDLQNGVNYTINATVAMDSGLSANATLSFDVNWSDEFYDVFGDVVINKETLEASIHPYCYEYNEVQGEIQPSLTQDCVLAIYRREYDGSFTLIADQIENSENIYITDPHPSLDYARYRIVATSNENGAISYSDIPIVKVGEPSVVIQWAEEWSYFEANDNGDGAVEPTWAGSMIRIPYNITTSEKAKIESELVNYIGRKHPVSYYGTHQDESATWTVEIPKTDNETIYALRRLSKWSGDCYVREPNGVGYWANVGVSFNLNYDSLVVPISFNITRVEGGI